MSIQIREEHIAERIHEERGRAGLSQRALAAGMNERGHASWAQTTVARTELATRPLRVNELVDLADIFGVSVVDLLGPASTSVNSTLVAELRAEIADLKNRMTGMAKVLTHAQGGLSVLLDLNRSALSKS